MRSTPRWLVLTLALAAVPSLLPWPNPPPRCSRLRSSGGRSSWRTSSRGSRLARPRSRTMASGSATGSRHRRVTRRSSSGARRRQGAEVPRSVRSAGGRRRRRPRRDRRRRSDARRSSSPTIASGSRSRPTHARREAQRLRRQRRPVQSGVTVVNLATGEKKEYPRIRRFAFSGEASTWIALQRFRPTRRQEQSRRRRLQRADAAVRRGAARPPARHRSHPPRSRERAGAERRQRQRLLLPQGRQAARAGDRRAGQGGNGLQLRDMTTGTVAALDSGNASYERLTWSDKGDALAVLKGTDDRAFRDKFYAVVGVTGFGDGAPQKVSSIRRTTRVPEGHLDQPEPRRRSGPTTCEALIFGIYEPRPRDDADGRREPTTPDAARRRAMPRRPAAAPMRPNADDKVDLVLWHYKDPRLQSQQEVQEARDRAFNYVAEYRVQPKKFIRLADDDDAERDGRAEAEPLGLRHRRPRVRADGQPRRPPATRTSSSSTWRPAQRKLAVQARCATSPARRPTANRSSITRTATTTSTRSRPARTRTSRRGCAGVVRRRRRRPQQRQAADQRDGLGERQQVGAAQRRLGHLAGPGRRRRRRST